MKKKLYAAEANALTEALRALPVAGRLHTPWGWVVCRRAGGGNANLQLSACRPCALLPYRGSARRCPLFGTCSARGRADGLSVCFEAVPKDTEKFEQTKTQ